MKISTKHYEILRTAMNDTALCGGSLGDARQSYSDRGLSYGRWLYDWLYACRPEGQESSRWICDNLYPAGLDDSHLTAPLKRIDREKFGAWPNPATQTLNGKRIA